MKTKAYFTVLFLSSLLLSSVQTAAAAQADTGSPIGSEDMASVSTAAYEVHFVDAKDFNRRIFNSQRGRAKEGTDLVIDFPKQLIGADGYLWEAVSDSPRIESLISPGTQKIYIRFEKKEICIKPEPEDEGKKKLERWLRRAWEADCQMTGSDPDGVPPPSLIVKNGKENDSRIKNLVSMIDDAQWHYFYLIGQNYRPQTQLLGAGFDAEYSSSVLEEFLAGKETYTVVKAGVKRVWKPDHCTHRWEKSQVLLNGCLTQGQETILCEKCRTEETILLPALGHRDADGDSLCDRCKKRAFSQSEGDQLRAVLLTPGGPLALSFTCLDDDYLGSKKMLYLADEALGPELTGICFEDEDGYAQSAIRRYFRLGFVNELSMGSALLQIPWQDQMEGADFAGLLSRDEYERYKERISQGERYFLRTSEAENTIQAVEADGSVVTVPAANNQSYGARPFIILERPETGDVPESHLWRTGDLQLREIGGQEYLFRCIDEDYSDSQSTHRNAALFLCDRVIRSDIDSTGFELRVFSFGEDNNYKNSEVRSWLAGHASDSLFQTEPIYTGVNTAYTGSTGKGMFAQLDASGLKPHAIGFQLLDDRLFCLSAEEALKYRNELWRFAGSSEDNPNTQLSPYSGGYYLRTPVYAEEEGGQFHYTDQIYVVDLYQGNIHPAGTDSTGIGLRPAFALPQGAGPKEALDGG